MINPRPADLILHSAPQLLTLAGGPQRGRVLGRLGIIADGALAIEAGVILEAGPSPEVRAAYRAREEIDASGRAVLPGLVDAHTHLVWAGDRADEFERRQAGASYLDILAAGGGILSTVRATRRASTEELVRLAQPRLQAMARHGTTTAEVKSGYGLDIDTEIRMLEAIRLLDSEGPIQLLPTYLGAHAIPEEYAGRSGAYVEFVVRSGLPAVAEAWRAARAADGLPFVDVFCERGAFSLEECRRILQRAREMGFPLKVHAEEFTASGAARLAAEFGATSVDHLNYADASTIEELGASQTVAVLLPATPFGLGESRYAPAKALLEADALLALGSDLNPGTAWCESLPFVIALACRSMGLSPAQAVASATINSAAAIGRSAQVGSLEPGKDADFVILDAEDYRHLAYRFGSDCVSAVYRRGVRIAGSDPSPVPRG